MSEQSVRYVLDTDTVTYHQLGRVTVAERLVQVEPRQVATTVLTLEEQIQGWLAAVRRQQNPQGILRAYQLLEATHNYFCQVPVLPFDEPAFGLYRELLARRVRIGTHDLRIAAITLSRRATLITTNRRHFDQIAELPIEDWNRPVT